jgi:FkbM family methyltransferase
MTNERALADINDIALKQRKAEERSAPDQLKSAKLSDLLKKPAYIGFVEGSFLAGLDFVMFLCDRDDGIALRLLWKREFEPASLAIWRRLAMAADLVVDVGGHTGIYSIVAGLANPKARVHTFEPHEMNFGRLLLNLRANGLTGKNAHNLAASRSAGAVPFMVKINHYLSAGGSIVPEDQEFAKMVPCGPIDDHVPLEPRNVCVKIDTEGHEVEVLAGMPKLLERKPNLILECAFVPTMLETEVDLKAAGYSFYYIDDRRWQLDAIDTLAEPPVGVGPTDRENVLITTMSEQDVRAMFQRARDDYEEAIQNIAAGQDDPLTAPLQP